NFEEPSLLFNIAQCERQLGMKQDAIYAYRAYLRETGNAPNRDEVNALIDSLEKAFKEEQVAKSKPPEGALESHISPLLPPPEATKPPVVSQVVLPTKPERPAHKKWWFWTAIGVGVAAAVGAGVGVALATKSATYPSGGMPSDGS